jgi:hypothetical protein
MPNQDDFTKIAPQQAKLELKGRKLTLYLSKY